MQIRDHSQSNIFHRAASGGVLLVIGLGMLVIGWNYPTGQLTQMGPGYVPRAIAVMICAIALVMIITDITGATIAKPSKIQWRSLIFVSASMLIFAFLVDVAGLVPSVFFAVIVSMLADREAKPLSILIYATLATSAGWLLFLVVLELPIPAFWRWS